jgi:FKBP-type peptidyl-prolyl cis-trans isomerase
MKTKLLILGLAAVCFSSCQQYKKGGGGVLYKIHKDESGPTLKEGDFVSLKAVYKTENDSVMYSSYDFDQPTFIPMQKSAFKGDLFECLGLLSEGDSATFKLPVDSLTKRNMPVPSGKGKYVMYTFKVEKVIPKGKLTDSELNLQAQAYINKEREKAKNAEAGKIEAYVKEKKLEAVTTPSGLKYVVTQKGSGPVAAKGDTVQANYTLYLLNGRMFDTSLPDLAKKAVTYNQMRTYEPIKFPVGDGGSIPGFEEGLMLFPKGTKVTLIIPSKLAYGEQGSAPIAPYTPLVFDIDVLNVTKAATPPAAAAPAAAQATPKK